MPASLTSTKSGAFPIGSPPVANPSTKYLRQALFVATAPFYTLFTMALWFLLAALPAALIADPAHAIDPNETQVTLPDQYQWKPGLPGAPAQSVETVPVFGDRSPMRARARCACNRLAAADLKRVTSGSSSLGNAFPPVATAALN